MILIHDKPKQLFEDDPAIRLGRFINIGSKKWFMLDYRQADYFDSVSRLTISIGWRWVWRWVW